MLYRMMLIWLVAAGLALAQVQISPGRYQNMYEVYTANKDRGQATLVTSDSVLHTAHVLFDYTLRAAEVQQFGKRLREMSMALTGNLAAQAAEEARRQYIIAPPPYGYDRAAAYTGVALRLLEPTAQTPEIIKPLVDKEVALILAADGMAISPVMGVTEDYTQYKPRGHYTRNETLQRYFRAMMWYGRAGFPLAGEKAPGVPLTEEERRANAWAGIVLSQYFDGRPLYRHPNSPTFVGLWEAIYRPTEFLVGPSDDLTPPEYLQLTRKVFGETLPGGWTADAQAKTDQFIAEALALRPPRILSTLQTDRSRTYPVALRLLGQRFVPDSAMFQRLVHPQVPERLLPSGLDIMAVLGSSAAQERLRGELSNPKYGAQYTAQLSALQAQVNAMSDADWRKTAYLIWLKTIRDLVADPGLTGHSADGGIGRGWPAWWTDPVWQAKQLNAGLGSWAELRHDTILYTKQSYTMGVTSFRPPAPVAIVYVEPVPQVYGGLITLLTVVREHLTAQGVFPQEMAPNYDEFTRLLRGLLLISSQELMSPAERARADYERPTEEDCARVCNIGALLKQIETLPEPLRGQLTGTEDAQAALIADVHTDPNSARVLEVGVGQVWTVAVPVTDGGGRTVTAIGPIFSYYEFPQPLAQRLTDAEWQQMLQKGQQPPAFIFGK